MRTETVDFSDKIVAARGLVLLDQEKNPRASLMLGENDEPRLEMCDSDGSARVTVSVIADGPAVVLYGSAGEPALSLHLSEHGRGRIGLQDAGGATRMFILLTEMGEPRLGFVDELGRLRLTVGLGAGLPSAALLDEQEDPRLSLGLRADGTPYIAGVE